MKKSWLPALVASVVVSILALAMGGCGEGLKSFTPDWASYTEEATFTADRGAISGTVVDKNGTPVAGATVTLSNARRGAGVDYFSTTTKSDGTYAIGNIEPGTYDLLAAKSGIGEQTRRDVVVRAGQVTPVNFQLAGEVPTTGRIVGKVTDAATGSGLANITVAVEQLRSRATTGSDGSYTIGALAPGIYLVTATDATGEYVSNVKLVTVVVGEDANGDLQLGTSDYAGSARCQSCHSSQYAAWQTAAHSKMIQYAVGDSSVFIADPALGGLSDYKPDIIYTIGSLWKQRYLILDPQTTEYYILPRQYIKKTDSWADYHAADWNERPWRAKCMGCHTTGFSEDLPAPNKFREVAIGCEECHGPAKAHAENPGATKPVNPADLSEPLKSMVCGACHNRGKDPDDVHGFPVAYTPGQDLSGLYNEIQPGDKHLWPDGSAKGHHQQYLDWKLSKHYQHGIGCVNCHGAHGGQYEHQTIANPEDNSLCYTCHSDKAGAGLTAHTHHDTDLETHKGSRCTKCHMPKVAKSATKWDIHSHTFQFISPQKSLDTLTDGDIMPNSCMAGGCHETSIVGEPVYTYDEAGLTAALNKVKEWWPTLP